MANLRHVIEFLVNPYFLCILVIALCVIIAFRRSQALIIRIGLLSVLLVLLIISTGWLPHYLTYKLEGQYPVINKVDPQIHWIVVLSGGQSQTKDMPVNNLLSSASIKRLVEGVRLYRMLPNAQLVLSGGGESREQPEALLLEQLSKWFAIPPQAVVLEQKSINTADQARELAAIVHKKPFYLVTSAIHMPRSMLLCQQQGLHPIAAPTDFTFYWNSGGVAKTIIPNVSNLNYFSIVMHESLGRAWAYLRVLSSS